MPGCSTHPYRSTGSQLAAHTESARHAPELARRAFPAQTAGASGHSFLPNIHHTLSPYCCFGGCRQLPFHRPKVTGFITVATSVNSALEIRKIIFSGGKKVLFSL